MSISPMCSLLYSNVLSLIYTSIFTGFSTDDSRTKHKTEEYFKNLEPLWKSNEDWLLLLRDGK